MLKSKYDLFKNLQRMGLLSVVNKQIRIFVLVGCEFLSFIKEFKIKTCGGRRHQQASLQH